MTNNAAASRNKRQLNYSLKAILNARLTRAKTAFNYVLLTYYSIFDSGKIRTLIPKLLQIVIKSSIDMCPDSLFWYLLNVIPIILAISACVMCLFLRSVLIISIKCTVFALTFAIFTTNIGVLI